MSSSKQLKRAAASQLKRNSRITKLFNSVEGSTTARHIDGSSEQTSTQFLPRPPEKPSIPPLASLPVSDASAVNVEVDAEPEPEGVDYQTQVRYHIFRILRSFVLTMILDSRST